MDDPSEWLLTSEERGNPGTSLPAWTRGNLVRPLVHGAAYFDRLVEVVEQLGDGDRLWFTDWRGDPDERLRPDGPTVDELFSAAAHRGVDVRGLVWRSHTDALSYSKEENRALDREIEEDGGRVVLDQRVRRVGSHHQKIVLIRCPADPSADVAFAGGIDLCHSRRDDAAHEGDPQPVDMASGYGPTPPWHDVQAEIRGPAVAVLDTAFRERWDDPTSPVQGNPIAYVVDRFRRARLDPSPLPPELPPPPECGPHLVQTLRTYPKIRPRYDFAPEGERSIARGYSKAVEKARRLVYLEDQYLWSSEVAQLFADALTDNPELHLVVVVPRIPDQEGAFNATPQYVGRRQAIDLCIRAGGKDRVHVFDVENQAGTPVYVHSKVCVVDDVWASIGSDNFNRRSWTHDSELSTAVLDTTRDPRAPQDPAGTGDGARTFARDLRLELAREHLDLADDGSDDDLLLDPARFVSTLESRAAALAAWHEDGRRGPRPPGRLRPHDPERLSRLTKLWATPVYRLLVDPDGRPLRLRLRKEF
ncbi:phospholipase D family protein [Blastococcus xanthinilyticus]|uniref:Phosphatidylserine/phosphatidylglycerophosphate/ cardiolipin synthase-like enzyme n=1 Tax=Blastococcus xanthinilyticus TaxID=1564164 RepID=A0A5S5CTI1_9ACTN|nr:phospholipase D-like domain-containing protein [Blastococcus xanthinilyticus]TYP87097.1 phosphatidylserine/phosphatidylglycerophosphate/cardiolipin synthase-like enzyme [Blastococcus xanthinilyticus]